MPRKRLRSGFTTGTAAAAAAKAALQTLLEQAPPRSVRIAFLSEGHVDIPVHRLERLSATTAVATVIKDAGDDPDVTHGAEIGARVTLVPAGALPPENPVVTIRGGEGVGRITKPGLGLPPGEPAINAGPRRMIGIALEDVLTGGPPTAAIDVEIFVPAGEDLARRTLNARLGIVGGLSILGTTGIVRPLSHEAYTATIRSALSVARAAGREAVAMTTGRRSERHLQTLLNGWAEEQFVQMGDYFQFAMAAAGETGFRQVTLAAFFGKAVKMAMGAPHTHAARSVLLLGRLADWTGEATGRRALAESVRRANTARHAFELLGEDCPEVVARVGKGMVTHAAAFAQAKPAVRGLIFDYDGRVVYDSEDDRTHSPKKAPPGALPPWK